MTTTADPPVLSAWSAVSGFGIGRAAFAAGLTAGAPVDTELDPDQWQVPVQRAALVPDFDARAELGRKGTRSMDRATALAVTAVGRLLNEECGEWRRGIGENTGLVLGTTTGSAQSIMDFTRDSFEGDKPFFVDPARFPNTVMNCASGQCAIWYGLRGPNATVAGGRLAGLYALNYAARMLRGGRAETVLCGAVEEYSRARAWLEHHAGRDGDSGLLGEGCAIWKVEAGGGDGLAEVLSVRFGVPDPSDPAATFTTVIKNALRTADAEAADLWAVSPCCAPGVYGDVERRALEKVLVKTSPTRIVPGDLLGDTAAAGAALQVSAVLAVAESDRTAASRLALVTGIDPEGAVGCAVLRLR